MFGTDRVVMACKSLTKGRKKILTIEEEMSFYLLAKQIRILIVWC